jgi:hypothetical protein
MEECPGAYGKVLTKRRELRLPGKTGDYEEDHPVPLCVRGHPSDRIIATCGRSREKRAYYCFAEQRLRSAPTAVTQFSNFVGRKSSLFSNEDDPAPLAEGAAVEVQPTTVQVNVANNSQVTQEIFIASRR